MRLLRSWLTAAMLAVIVGNALQRMAGVKTELLISNVVGVVLVILLNWLVITGDKSAFYGRWRPGAGQRNHPGGAADGRTPTP